MRAIFTRLCHGFAEFTRLRYGKAEFGTFATIRADGFLQAEDGTRLVAEATNEALLPE